MAQVEEDAVVSGGSIEQVREILFGAQQREMQTRFDRVERSIERSAREAHEALDETRKGLDRRIDETQAMLSDRLDALGERVEETLAALRREMGANAKSMSDRLTEAERSPRSDMDNQARQAKQRIDDLRVALEEALRQLEDGKTGRSELGAYLMELGVRLSGDPTMDNIQAALQQTGSGKADGSAQEK